MTNLATRARSNRKAALQGLARRRSENVVDLAFAKSRAYPEPVLSFAARREACPELSALPPSKIRRSVQPPLVLVSSDMVSQAA